MAVPELEPNKSAKQSIQELQSRYQKLDKKKTQAETNLENAKNALEKLQHEAKTKFGTDDVAALKAKLKEMEEANEKARGEYQKSLDAIEAALEAVETNLPATGTVPIDAAGAARNTGPESGSAAPRAADDSKTAS